jgi:hypothetical protein
MTISSTEENKKNKWVFRSTDSSIGKRQYSFLGIVDTIIIFVLYLWLAYRFEYQRWLYITAFAAPLILLRSKVSVRYGVKMLKEYRDKPKETSSTIEKGILTSITIAITGIAIFFSMQFLFVEHQGWELFLWASILTLSAEAFAIVLYVALAAATTNAFSGIIAVTGVFTVAASIESTYEKYIFLRIMKIPRILLLFIGMALGIWLRGLCIRTRATLKLLIKGLSQMPHNLHEILWVVDLSHLPELLPDAKKIHPEYSVGGLFDSVKRHITKDKDDKAITITGVILMGIIWYFLTLFWRWSLKATLWLWWPIAFAFRQPFDGKTEESIKKTTTLRVYGLSKWLVVLAMAVMAWIVLSYFPQQQLLVSLLPEEAQILWKQFNQTVPVPEVGLRLITLFLCCVATMYVGWLSHNFSILDNDKNKRVDMSDETIFSQHAKELERFHTLRVFIFILYGYSYILFQAYSYYPNELMRIIPSWLLNFL